jgi:hypothetical protein
LQYQYVADSPGKVDIMITDAAVAEQISDLMLEFSARLDRSIIAVQKTWPPEEFRTYRVAVGKIMGEMLLEVMNPLYAQHPSIKPPGLD